MYDLSIMIPDAGSEKGYFTIHIDSFPRAKMAYDFLKNPPDTVKKTNTILVAMQSIVEAYGGRAPLDKYNKIFDKHISLMDYLLSRYTYDMIFASDA